MMKTARNAGKARLALLLLLLLLSAAVSWLFIFVQFCFLFLVVVNCQKEYLERREQSNVALRTSLLSFRPIYFQSVPPYCNIP